MDGRSRVIGALWFFQVANYFDRTALSFAGPAMMASLGLSPSQFGFVLSAFAIGFGVSQIPGGMLADRRGARPLLALAPLLWAVFTGSTAFAAGIATLVALRIGLGLSEGLCNSASVKVIGDVFPPRDRSFASGVISTSIAMAPAAAGPIIGLLLQAHGWRSVFLVMTAPAIASALLNFLCIPPTRPAADGADAGAGTGGAEPFGRTLRATFALPSLWLASAAWFFFYIALSGFLGWMPSYLALSRHVGGAQAGLISGVPFAAGTIGLIAIGWLGSRLAPRRLPQVLAVAYLGAAASLAAAYAAPTLPLCVAGLSGAAFFILGTIGTFAALGLQLAPAASRATCWGVISTVGQIGAVAAPSAIGLLVGRTGDFAWGFALMAAALVAASGCVILLLPFLRGEETGA